MKPPTCPIPLPSLQQPLYPVCLIFGITTTLMAGVRFIRDAAPFAVFRGFAHCPNGGSIAIRAARIPSIADLRQQISYEGTP